MFDSKSVADDASELVIGGRKFVPAGSLPEQADSGKEDWFKPLPEQERISAEAVWRLKYQKAKEAQALTVLGLIVLVPCILVFLYSPVSLGNRLVALLPGLVICITAEIISGYYIYTGSKTLDLIRRARSAKGQVISVTDYVKRTGPVLSVQEKGKVTLYISYRFETDDGTTLKSCDSACQPILFNGGVDELVLYDPNRPNRSILFGTLAELGLRQDPETGQIIVNPDYRTPSLWNQIPLDKTRNEIMQRCGGPESVFIHGLRYEPAALEKEEVETTESAAKRWYEQGREISAVSQQALKRAGDVPTFMGSFTIFAVMALVFALLYSIQTSRCSTPIEPWKQVVTVLFLGLFWVIGMGNYIYSVWRGRFVFRLLTRGELVPARLVAVSMSNYSEKRSGQTTNFLQGRYVYETYNGANYYVYGSAKKEAVVLGTINTYVLYDPDQPQRAIVWDSLTPSFSVDRSGRLVGGSTQFLLLGFLHGALWILSALLLIRLFM